MATFTLDTNFTATCTPYRHGAGYVMKGTIFCAGKPVRIFQAEGMTLTAAEEAAQAQAEEIWRRLKAAKGVKRKKARS